MDLSLGAAVTSLDPAARTVTTDAGAQLHYDKLLLATGFETAAPRGAWRRSRRRVLLA